MKGVSSPRQRVFFLYSWTSQVPDVASHLWFVHEWHILTRGICRVYKEPGKDPYHGMASNTWQHRCHFWGLVEGSSEERKKSRTEGVNCHQTWGINFEAQSIVCWLPLIMMYHVIEARWTNLKYFHHKTTCKETS